MGNIALIIAILVLISPVLIIGVGTFFCTMAHERGPRKSFVKWRKLYPTLRTFEIRQSEHLFGISYYENPSRTLKALDAEHAAKRYLNWYRRNYKRRHRLDDPGHLISETTFNWGIIEITCVETGFQTYYH